MFKQFSMAAMSLVVLSACACSTTPETNNEIMYDSEPVDASIQKTRDMLAAKAGDRVFFAFDSSALSTESRSTLKAAAEFLKSNSSKINTVIVEGHADERGTREYNLALGDRRAVAAKKYLVGLGVDASKIETISFGKERPAVTGHDEAAWAKNRRGVIVIK